MEKVPYGVDPEWAVDPVQAAAREKGEGSVVPEGIVSAPGAERPFRIGPVPHAKKHNVPTVDRPWSGRARKPSMNARDDHIERGSAVCE